MTKQNKQWNKYQVERWLKKFWRDHREIPTAILRKELNGPDDTTLLKTHGSALKALQDSGLPIEDGDVSKHRWAPNTMEGVKKRNAQIMAEQQAQVLTSRCMHCEWEMTDLASITLVKAREHAREEHGYQPPKTKRRWKNGTLPPSDNFSRQVV